MNPENAVAVTSHENDELKLQESKLENDGLKLQLQCQEEVIQKIQILLTTEEKRLNEKLETIWLSTARFLEESNEFHQEFGLSSPWWNAQIMSLQHPDIQNTEGFHKQKQKALEAVETETEKIAQDVQVQREEMTKLRNQIAAHDAHIVEQKIMEEMLQKEPFGAEFSSLKLKLQRSKDTCQQLETVLANREKSQVRKRGPETCLPTIMTQKVIRTEESTTFVYRTSYGTRNAANGKSDKKQLEYYQLQGN